MTLGARRQLSIFVDNSSLFQTHFAGITAAFEGTLRLTVTSGGPIAVTSLVQKTSNGSLLVVPVESAVTGP